MGLLRSHDCGVSTRGVPSAREVIDAHARLRGYVELIEDFLAHRTQASDFSDVFFRRWQADEAPYDEPLWDILNWIALGCECFTEDPRPGNPFDLSEEELRSDCADRIGFLRSRLSE